MVSKEQDQIQKLKENHNNQQTINLNSDSTSFNKFDTSNSDVFEDKVMKKLQLRKNAYKQELENRRKKINENLEGEKLIYINVNNLNIDFKVVKNEITSFNEAFQLLSNALEIQNKDLFKYYIYLLRIYLTRVDININIDEYYKNTENFINLIELLEFYYKQNEFSITYEIMWIFNNVFNNIQNTPIQSHLFTFKLVNILSDVFFNKKFEQYTEHFIYMSFMIIGNAVQFSPSNRELVFESKIALFIKDFFTNNSNLYTQNILRIICWVCSLFFSSSRELDYETVSFIYF